MLAADIIILEYNMEYDYDLDKKEFKYIKNDNLNELLEQGQECSIRIKIANVKDAMAKIESLDKMVADIKLKFSSIVLDIDKDYIEDEDELSSLNTLAEQCEKLGIKCNLCLKDGIGNYQEFIVAKKKVEEFLNKLHNLKISENGKERGLTVAERFFVVYNYASNRVYNMNEHFFSHDMRNWIGVLNSDHVICSGFASLLKFLCDREFTKDELVCFTQGLTVYNKEDHQEIAGHANNIVYINDPQYGINNFTYNDACWDCKNDNLAAPTFNFFMLNPNDIFNYTYRSGKNIEYGFTSEIFYDDNKNTFNKDVPNYDFFSRQKITENFVCGIIGGKTSKQIIEDFDINSKLQQEYEKHNLSLKERIAARNTIKEKYNKLIEKLINENKIALKAKYKKFNQSLVLPSKLLRNGLTAVALMQGLTAQSDIDKFVEEKTKQREIFRKEKLGMQEPETDYDEEEIEI